MNPDSKNTSRFKQDSQFTVQRGSVFHFKCLNGRVDSLQMCPSGTIFVRNACQPINSCTDKPEGTLFNDETMRSKYVECRNGKEIVLDCPDNHVFHHNRCELVQDLNHYCNEFTEPFLFDRTTLVECRNKKPYYLKCKPGTRYFDKNYCEPNNCLGLPDGTKLPLPEQNAHSFKFIPGYMTCRNDKIDNLVQCPQKWDSSLSREDDTTFLPMVFDGLECSIPSFCQNVFSDDPDIVVPSHNFVKHVKNWKFSKFLDHTVGYACENGVRKRRVLSPGEVISKRFKIEPACGEFIPEKLPIYENARSFYDCVTKSTVDCPPATLFNGSKCIPLPRNAFFHENFPLFEFDSLNAESWIKPWDYSNDQKVVCRDPESEYVKLYNICSHPDCLNYAFASQIPDFAILLPREKRAQCQYDEKEKSLKMQPVSHDYLFWNQKMLQLDDEKDVCDPGQRVQTGNFIWDRTVYATCNLEQPFLFCPSAHTLNIFPVNRHLFACEPPDANKYFMYSKEWTPYDANEIKRILPATNLPTTIRKSKGLPFEPLPPAGKYIREDVRINLAMTQPVFIEPRYRVTYPPNVAFHYKHDSREIKTSTPDHSFLVKMKNFTDKLLHFPRYKPIIHADSFQENTNVM